MTDKKDLPEIGRKYILHFDEGIKNCFSTVLCSRRQQIGKDNYYDFASGSIFSPMNQIVVYTLREGYFILSEGNIIPLKIKGCPEQNEVKRYDRRIPNDKIYYSTLIEKLVRAKS